MEKNCPITKVIELLSDTWTMRIMCSLLEGSKRFSELERELSGISTRTLTNKLRILEQAGLAEKAQTGTYVTTPKGKGLRGIQRAMRRYSEQFL